MDISSSPPLRSGGGGSGRRPETEGVSPSATRPLSHPAPLDDSSPASQGSRQREQIKKTARDFEAAFIGQMLNQMFEGVETAAPFGGGPGEQAFKSFLTEAVAKQMVSAGGLGLADDLQRDMLKLQGLE